ncbi:VOC family protein [Embleya sp. NBC_00896]|uniref:VOC family protein n=1 Tax=Embleya sp. NBC_00896 TaxID=2975961 RepID=UPI00386AD01E|nr:VOC family protein [Embleya sp. NBC_00896]
MNAMNDKKDTSVKATPDGYTTVTPWILSHDTAGLIEYLTATFGAVEVPGSRFVGENGLIGHAEVRIGDAIVMMFDIGPDAPASPAYLRLYVEDADEAHRRAVAAGGTSVTEVTHLFFGDRVGRVRDPFGNLWWIQTHVEDVAPEELERRLGDPEFIAAMEYVQGAEFFPKGAPARG